MNDPTSPKVSPKNDRLLTRRELAERWNLSERTLKRRDQSGDLSPITLSPRVVRYRLSDILAIESDAAAGN